MKNVSIVIGENLKHKIVFSSITIALVGVLFGFGLTTFAYAYATSGCKYSSGSIDPISYRFFSVAESSYVDATKYGANAWNATSTPGYFSEESLSLDPEVNVTDDAYGANTFYAKIEATCTGGGVYSGNEVNFIWNTDEAPSRTTSQKQRIGTHELGHAYGLAHVSTLCRIMRADVGYMTDCTITTPAADDIDGANAVNS
ncbi:MAG: hypothetical protein WDO06_06980 [Actinomycetota bacterium]